MRRIYAYYLGWYDGNPATLDGLPPPRNLVQRTLDYMGGTEAVLTRAEADFTAGDYSWVMHIVDQIIWAEADKYVGPPAGGPTPIWLWRGKPNMAQCLLVGGQRVATRGAEGG